MAVDVSIIIVNWNGRDYLLNCLNSIAGADTPPTLEIIVVDNASTDGGPETVAGDYPHVRLIRNDRNLGFSRANNIGIREATGRYVCLVNSDVLVTPRVFNVLVDYMDAHPGAGMVGPRVLNADGTLQTSCYRVTNPLRELVIALGLDNPLAGSPLSTRYDMSSWPTDTPRPIDMMIGCFNLVRREGIDEVGVMEERLFFYGDDMDWCKRFREAGWDVVYNPTVEITHFGGASAGAKPIPFLIEYQKARLEYWTIHHGPMGRAFCAAMLLLHHSVRIAARTALHPLRPSDRKANAFKIKSSLACVRWLIGLGVEEDAQKGLETKSPVSNEGKAV